MKRFLTGLLLAGLLAFEAAAQVTVNPSVTGFPPTYAEGTWTPTDASGAALSFTGVNATYTKIGNLTVARFTVTYPATADGTAASIGGLPFTAKTVTNAAGACTLAYNNNGTAVMLYVLPTSKAINVYNAASGATVSNATLSTREIDATCTYQAST